MSSREAAVHETRSLSEDQLRMRLTDFARAQGCDDVALGPLTRFTSGFSWLTYGLQARWRDASGNHDRDLILRLGAPSGMLAPYSAEPEFRALSSLARSGVPVPDAVWWSDDSEALGAPFLVCGRMTGEAPLPWTVDGSPVFDETRRLALAEQFVAALARVHNVDWRGTEAEGLPGARFTGEAASAQIAAWEERLRRWSQRRFPMLAWALRWLKEHAPEAPRLSIVHGDYRIGNFLVEGDRITAILDWELVHLGDPHEDLGWMCLHAFRGRSPYMCHLLTRQELCAAYERHGGHPVCRHALHYYEAFGCFKLAAIHLAAANCIEERRSRDLRMVAMGAQLPRLLLQLKSVIEAAP